VSAAGFDQLSERHKECLRLVLLHYDSKQIARQLNLSPHTVNKYLQDAARHIGAGDRFAAARMFAEYEHGPEYERFVYEQIGMEEAAQERARLQASTALPASRHADHAARDAAPPGSDMHMVGGFLNESLIRGTARNELTSVDRLKLIGFYAMGFLIAFALLSNIADTILRALMRAFSHS
jgi:DNA-binding CsgD family transcriptional regulator